MSTSELVCPVRCVTRAARVALVAWALWGCGAEHAPAGGSGGASASGPTTGSGAAGGASGAGGGAWAECDGAGQCELVEKGCCPACEPVSLSAYEAVHRAHAGAYNDSLNCEQAPGCAAGCEDVETWNRPHFAALCRKGRCAAVDVRVDELSACSTDDDCRLRWALGCCECGGGDVRQLVALRGDAAIEKLVCESGGCADGCVPAPYPANARAVCGSSGHCEVRLE